MKKQPTSWRARTVQQQKDKNEIYQSREWRELRVAKYRANPLCEMCEAEGIVHATEAIHHKHPIEDSSTKEEMRKWAFMWSNLQSLCRYHHAKVHREMGSNTKAKVAERAEARQARWKQSLLDRFALPAHSESEYVDYEEVTDDDGDQPTSETGGG